MLNYRTLQDKCTITGHLQHFIEKSLIYRTYRIYRTSGSPVILFFFFFKTDNWAPMTGSTFKGDDLNKRMKERNGFEKYMYNT